MFFIGRDTRCSEISAYQSPGTSKFESVARTAARLAANKHMGIPTWNNALVDGAYDLWLHPSKEEGSDIIIISVSEPSACVC